MEIDIHKLSKKKQKEFYSQSRGLNGFNTGTRDMQSEKHPSRAKEKQRIRKEEF